MGNVPPISPDLLPWLLLFVAGLLALGVVTPLAVWLVWRRGALRSDDYAVRLVHNSAVPFGLQLIVRAIDFGFGIILFNMLARSQSALASYEFAALMTTLVLATVAEWGLNIYLTREVARDPAAIRASFGTALAIRAGLALLVIPASLVIVLGYNSLAAADLVRNGIDRQGLWLMVLLGCTVLPSAFSGAVTALFLATERPIIPAVVGLLTNVLSALLKVAALVAGFGVIGVAWAALAATIGSTALFAALLVRFFGWPGLRFDRAQAWTMLRAGFPLMLNALLLAVFFRFDVTIIKAYRLDAEYNAYAAAYKYVGLTQILPPIVINAIFPLFARQAIGDRQALRRAYTYTVRLLVLLALPLAAAVTVLRVPLIQLYGTEHVAVGAPALALLIWYLPLSYVNGVTQYLLIALDRPRTITVAFGLAAVFNFSFNLAFVPRYGVSAAAVATVLAEIVLYLPLWWVLRREIQPAPLWRLLWRPATAAFGMAVAMLYALEIHLLLALIVAPLLFWGLLLVVGEVHETDRRLARRVLRRA